MKTVEHLPVLFHESVEMMKPGPGKTIVDCTLGRGGHTKGFLDRGASVIALDQDLEAIKKVAENFNLHKVFDNPLVYKGDQLTVVHANFKQLSSVLYRLSVFEVDGVFWDLGVSSPQFDEPERGFSYRFDAKLDMRMDQSQSITAWDVVNTYDLDELTRIIREYGEERYAKRIADQIAIARPINTTFELVEVIKKAMPKRALSEQHPAKRTFQAIRIAVNDELGALTTSLEKGLEHLKLGGRLVVISFHSLEDRIVKDFFKEKEDPCTCPKRLPVCVCGKKPIVKVITKKPVVPDALEVEENRRAHSAKLRVAEKIYSDKEVGK
ncbi:MAG: 16S rRNA (cytosine(1402)-N(4))-methyltransferase RsmH [Bacillota bacterium]|nr:16S rRNA (cytosine(1402)-N(4))-methyltransferase RsmH [Bacillota bacterium]